MSSTQPALSNKHRAPIGLSVCAATIFIAVNAPGVAASGTTTSSSGSSRAASTGVAFATNVAPSAPISTVESGRLAGLRYYVVQPGDTLTTISKSTGVSSEVIRIANGMTDSTVKVGYRLLLDIPNPTTPLPAAKTSRPAPAPGSVQTAVYTVRSGDTLAKIADRFDTSVAVIRWINGIADPHRISIGTTYVVTPGFTVEATASRGTTVSMSCPVEGATYSYDWGNVRGHGDRFHEGIDLLAPTGTAVRAMTDGVVEAGTGATSGKWVALKGDDGWQYYGAHLATVTKTGRVRAGEIIGTVGATGNAAGGHPHLHLELRPVNGRPANPLPVVNDAC